MEMINDEQAYQAMFSFLEKYFDQTHADDVGALLGSMRPLDDGRPADAAMWTDWKDSIRLVVARPTEKAATTK